MARGRLEFSVPDENLIDVLSPFASTPLGDLEGEIEKALDNPIGQGPLSDGIKPGDKVLIVSDDNTRFTPSDKIIPPMLARLNAAGVPDENISVIMALGTHRYMTEEEMKDKVGPEVFQRVRVFNHEWRDKSQLADLGVSGQGTPLWVNKAAVEADVVIGLGAIVPHHIPGYSGSSKIIQPGICGPATTAETHLLACSEGGDSFLGIVDNPVRRDLDDMADKVGMNTIFNVVMNSEGGVVGVFFRGEARRIPPGGGVGQKNLRHSLWRNPGHSGHQRLSLRVGFLAVAQIPVSGPAHGEKGRGDNNLHPGAGGGEPGAHRVAFLHRLAVQGDFGLLPQGGA